MLTIQVVDRISSQTLMKHAIQTRMLWEVFFHNIDRSEDLHVLQLVKYKSIYQSISVFQHTLNIISLHSNDTFSFTMFMYLIENEEYNEQYLGECNEVMEYDISEQSFGYSVPPPQSFPTPDSSYGYSTQPTQPYVYLPSDVRWVLSGE